MEINLLVSDLHVNSTVGLINPSAVTDEGGGIKPAKYQYWLYEKWNLLIERAVTEAKRGPLTVHLVGDLVDLDTKNRSTQFHTRNPATAVQWAAQLLEPLVQPAQHVFFYRGTEAHVGTSGAYEELTARTFDHAVQNPETLQYSWWWNLYRSGNVYADISHHPQANGTGRPFNKFSTINRLASDTVMLYANDLRLTPPDYVIRGHLHTPMDSRDNFRTRAIILPAWQGQTDFGHRRGWHFNGISGGCLLYTDGSKSHVEHIYFTPDPPKYFSSGMIKKAKDEPDN